MNDFFNSCLKSLLPMAHPAGGWGYASGRIPQVEPTCLSLLALSVEPEKYGAQIQEGLACLQRWQGEDGAFRVMQGPEEAVWPTALAIFVLHALSDDGVPRVAGPSGASPSGEANEGPATRATQVQRAAAWLLETKGRAVEDSDTSDIDPNLIGWPWIEGTFSWVEPTAWACMALQNTPWKSHARRQDGLRLLLDRAFDEGGVNAGNRRVLGQNTQPVVITTALMLLALAEEYRDHPRVQAAWRYLLRTIPHENDVENLCWSKLALDLWRDETDVVQRMPILDERIQAAYQERKATGLFAEAPMREALTALALATEKWNPFRPKSAVRPFLKQELPKVRRQRPSLLAKAGSAIRGLGVRAVGQMRSLPAITQVHVANVGDYQADLKKIVQEQYEAFRSEVSLKGKRVVLKPNLVEFHREKVINTHANVVAAAIELCQREGAREVIVAEGPGHWRNTEHLVTATGLGDVLRHYGVHFVDLNHDDPVKVPNLGRLTKLEYLYLSRTIATADVVISMPKLKTHHWAGVTISLKNLFGTLPGICYGWPKNVLHWQGIDNSIVDIALTRTPDLAIVDGIIAMEGDGPLNGVPKPLGVLVMGTDLLAVDATCCRLMQLQPEKVGYLANGALRRLGLLREDQIKQIGETIAGRSQPFETIPHFVPLHSAQRTPKTQSA